MGGKIRRDGSLKSLCNLKEFAAKEGRHVFGSIPNTNLQNDIPSKIFFFTNQIVMLRSSNNPCKIFQAQRKISS
jgi:hypothetical protein